MPLVRAVVVTHLSLTAALLLVLAVVVLCQRLTASARASAGAAPLPDHDRSGSAPQPVHVPAQEAAPRRHVPTAGASVLDWTIDLRTPAASANGPAAAGAAAHTSS